MSFVQKCSVKLVLEKFKRSEQYLECSGSPKTAHFQCGIRPKEGDTQASAKEAGNKPILSAALPLRCLPTWVHMLEAKLFIIFCRFGSGVCTI